MRIRTMPLLLSLPILLGACSCQRQGDSHSDSNLIAEGTDVEAALRSPPADALPGDTATQSHPSDIAARTQAASTLHAYLAELASGDHSRSDSYWSGGKPSPLPDDAILRELGPLASLRIQNDTPRPLDNESPTRSLEIPVKLRAQTDSGLRRFEGWYRLRAKVGGDGWEITGASLHPDAG